MLFSTPCVPLGDALSLSKCT